jgi:protein-tyrosine phosphatase
VYNARQTGGLATASGQHVRANVLIRAGELSALDASGCEALAALGVRTVIDLRAAPAVAAGPDVSCVTDTTNYYNADLPKLLPPTEENYLQTLDATEPVLGEIFARLSAANALPGIIHCVIGRDRASLMMALVLLALGVPQADVMDDFEHNQEAQVDPAWMNGVLARIEQAGGIESYLGQHGITRDQLAQLKQQALE